MSHILRSARIRVWIYNNLAFGPKVHGGDSTAKLTRPLFQMRAKHFHAVGKVLSPQIDHDIALPCSYSDTDVFHIRRVNALQLEITGDGYLLHSPNPYRLWFRVGFNSGVKDPSQGNRLDYQRLLHEAEEELAAAF